LRGGEKRGGRGLPRQKFIFLPSNRKGEKKETLRGKRDKNRDKEGGRKGGRALPFYHPAGEKDWACSLSYQHQGGKKIGDIREGKFFDNPHSLMEGEKRGRGERVNAVDLRTTEGKKRSHGLFTARLGTEGRGRGRKVIEGKRSGSGL